MGGGRWSDGPHGGGQGRPGEDDQADWQGESEDPDEWASELDKVKPHMDGRLTVKYVELDSGALQLNAFPKGCQDTHITILPEFVIPAGKVDEFKAGFSKFYAATKNGPGCCWLSVLWLWLCRGQHVL